MKAITYELEPDVQAHLTWNRGKNCWVIYDISLDGSPEHWISLKEDGLFQTTDDRIKTFDTAEEAEAFWLTVRTTAVRRCGDE